MKNIVLIYILLFISSITYAGEDAPIYFNKIKSIDGTGFLSLELSEENDSPITDSKQKMPLQQIFIRVDSVKSLISNKRECKIWLENVRIDKEIANIDYIVLKRQSCINALREVKKANDK